MKSRRLCSQSGGCWSVSVSSKFHLLLIHTPFRVLLRESAPQVTQPAVMLSVSLSLYSHSSSGLLDPIYCSNVYFWPYFFYASELCCSWFDFGLLFNQSGFALMWMIWRLSLFLFFLFSVKWQVVLCFFSNLRWWTEEDHFDSFRWLLFCTS